MNELEIHAALDRFVRGIGISIEAANHLEVLLCDNYPDDEFIQETVEILALYSPNGGEFLLSTAQVRQRLIETQRYLAKLKSSHGSTDAATGA